MWPPPGPGTRQAGVWFLPLLDVSSSPDNAGSPALIGKMAHLVLTLGVKIGYNFAMFGRIISLLLRMCLIAALWAFVWRLVEPRTQLMRILRAALLLLGLLGILAAIRATGG